MNLNNKHRSVAYLLALAFLLPIAIKTQHMMFPNHEHHCHSCTNHETGLLHICEIQDFDYFYFTPGDIVHIPESINILLPENPVEQTVAIQSAPQYDYGLRAPPQLVY
jgi:hypothetical protein